MSHNFLDRNLPTPEAFDHCIAVADVDGKEVWLDATAETCDYGDIPDEDRGVQALVIHDGVGEMKTIPGFTPEQNGQDAILHVELHADGSAHIVGDLTWRGRTRLDAEDLLASLSTEHKVQIMKNFVSQFSGGATLERADCTENKEGIPSLTVHLECTAPHWAKHVGDLLILPPVNAGSTPSQQALIDEKRVWPIIQDHATMSHVRIVVALPANATVAGMPEDVKNAGPLQMFERHLQCAPGGETLTIEQSYQELPGTISPDRYADVKAYNAALEEWADAQIVLHLGH